MTYFTIITHSLYNIYVTVDKIIVNALLVNINIFMCSFVYYSKCGHYTVCSKYIICIYVLQKTGGDDPTTSVVV